MNFVEDNLFINPDVTSPTGSVNICRNEYRIDGIDLRDFGVSATLGNISEVLGYPEIKEPFTDGNTYSLETIKMKHKEIVIPMSMAADDRQTFNNNYQAFYNAFAKAGLRTLYIKSTGGNVGAYYKDCTSYNIFSRGRTGAVFKLSFVIPNVNWVIEN
jgi:hypothetical protein